MCCKPCLHLLAREFGSRQLLTSAGKKRHERGEVVELLMRMRIEFNRYAQHLQL